MTSRVFVVRRSPLARPVLARTLTASLAAVLVVGALTACTGFSIDGGCDPVFDSGDASSIVTATGDVGGAPDVEFPTPLISDEVQRSVVAPGSGEAAEAGATIVYSYAYFVGETGEALTDSAAAVSSADERDLAFGEALECTTPGSRIVITGPAEQIDAQYAGNTETLVVVVDVLDVFLGKANGVNQLPQDGMPTVVTAVNGEPGITLTYQEAPGEARTSLIKAGGGATTAEGDQVVLNVRLWSWPAGVGSTPVLQSGDTWASGTPSVVDLSPEVITSEALYAAIEGAKVGSQLLVVIPAETDGGDASVFVIDILGILAQD